MDGLRSTDPMCGEVALVTKILQWAGLHSSWLRGFVWVKLAHSAGSRVKHAGRDWSRFEPSMIRLGAANPTRRTGEERQRHSFAALLSLTHRPLWVLAKVGLDMLALVRPWPVRSIFWHCWYACFGSSPVRIDSWCRAMGGRTSVGDRREGTWLHPIVYRVILPRNIGITAAFQTCMLGIYVEYVLLTA